MKVEMNCEMSESFRLAAVLAVIGGFLESYSFLLHGHVFANAQTGNMALCGMALATRDMMGAAKYALPVIAFASGVMLVDWVRSKWGQASLFHWRQGIVAVEAGLLCGCFFLKSGTHDALANLIVSIVCALQVQTFRKLLMCAVAMMRSSARRAVCGGEDSKLSSVSDAECD